MEDKFICIYNGPIRGDCCSHSQYKPREKMTVRELCDYIISLKDEWGYIGIKDGVSIFGNPQIEYYHGMYCDRNRHKIEKLESRFSEDILNSYVELIDWDGGWSRGDWLITLAGYKEKPIEEPAYDEFEFDGVDEIEQKIKNMSNEELERYILEAKARKLMKEEK